MCAERSIEKVQEKRNTKLLQDRFVRLSIDQIRCYEFNPRHTENPEYERIKASIRKGGLDQPLLVTQKPSEQGFVLQAGGNTRLKILKQLYQETGDDRFCQIDCIIKPWVDEPSILLAHFRENELRGQLTFIDRARAVMQAKALFEQGEKGAGISLSHLERILLDHGVRLSKMLLSRMQYAVERLLPLIPHALESGMGRPQIEKFRMLERAAYKLWSDLQIGEPEEMQEIFAALCQRYDGPEWDIELLEDALVHEVAQGAELSLSAVRLALAAVLEGRPVPSALNMEFEPVIPEKPETQMPEIEGEAPSETECHQEEGEEVTDGVGMKADQQSKDSAGEAALTPSINSVDPIETQKMSFARIGEKDAQGQTENTGTESNDQKDDAQTDRLNKLRLQAYGCAIALAEQNGLVGSIKAIDGAGLGYLVISTPEPVLIETLDPDRLGKLSALWWQLLACSDMSMAPQPILSAHLDSGSLLYQALAERQVTPLYKQVFATPPENLAYQLWRQINDQEVQDLVKLLQIYRQIHQYAQVAALPLWDESGG